MMTMATPDIEEHTPTTGTRNGQGSAEEIVKNHCKRLAKKHIKSIESPAAYLIVRNNRSKSSRSRRKRSTEIATLEPIDEYSLSVLRKTYKNSLKEITLNPNETPAEALRRYNAESIREALEKVHSDPLELAVERADVNVKENNLMNETAQHENQFSIHQPISRKLSQEFDNQLEQVSDENAISISNTPYVTLPVDRQQTQPLYVSLNRQQATYGSAAEATPDHLVPKFNAPGVFSNTQILVNSLKNGPYFDVQYGEDNQQSDGQSQFSYNDFSSSPTLSSSNAINQNLPQLPAPDYHLMDYDKAKMLRHENSQNEWPTSLSQFTNNNGNFNSYNAIRHPQIELVNRYRSQESSLFKNIVSFIQEKLDQCCNKCKGKILKGLEETFKPKHNYGRPPGKSEVLEVNSEPHAPFMHTSHDSVYRTPNYEAQIGYRQFLTEMAEKGYEKSNLTRQHQKDYLKDGKLNLYTEAEQDSRHELETIFSRDNQSCKRETNERPGMAVGTIKHSIQIEHIKKKEEDVGEIEAVTLKRAVDENPKSCKKIETTSEKDQETFDKNNVNKQENVTKIMDSAKPTIPNVYELRGQFRSPKANQILPGPKQGKQFSTYKNINKIGTAGTTETTKSNKNPSDKNDNLEEILDILSDLKSKESSAEEKSDVSIQPLYTSMASSAAINAITESSNTTNVAKKLSSRKIKTAPSKKVQGEVL